MQKVNGKNIYIFCFFIFFSLAMYYKLYAAGETASSFLLVDIPARETALGGIYTPYYAEPGAADVDPAALAGIKNKYAIFSNYVSVFSTHYEQIMYLQPQENYGAIGFSFMYDANDQLAKTDQFGNPIGNIDNSDMVLGAMYANDLTGNISAGINLKLLRSMLYTNQTLGASCNIGLLYKNQERNYNLGLLLENIGITSEYWQDKILLPILARGGYGMLIYSNRDQYSASLYIEERFYLNEAESAETALGLEVKYLNFLTFRYGYVLGGDEGNLAVGLGINWQYFTLDYAYKPFFISDNEHRITIKAEF